jgi:hypothetical protein
VKYWEIRVKQWVIRVLAVIVIVYGLMLFGDAFRAYTQPFVFLWIAIPIFACFLCRRSVSACFTLAGLRRLHTTLMIIVCALSFAMFSGLDDVRNRSGRHFVQGYHYWRGEPDMNDYGQMFYPGDHWTAKNRAGRWGISLFELTILIGVFAFPVVTHRAADRAASKKEAESLFTSDGRRIEGCVTYE